MTKAELISSLAELGITKSDAGKMLTAIKTVAIAAAEDGREFSIPGVVRLTVRHRAARKGRNPSTGAIMDIAAKRIVSPRVSTEIKRAVG